MPVLDMAKWIAVALLVFIGIVLKNEPRPLEDWLVYLTIWGFFLVGLWVTREE